MDSLIESPWNTTERRLRMTFSAALALHLILLIGLSFSVSTTPTQTHALEVTLALTPSDQTPDEADFIAQTSQLGSGDQANAMQPTTDLLSPFESPENNQAVPSEQRSAERSDPERLVSQRNSDNSASDAETADDQSAEQQVTDNSGAMRAELRRLRQLYSKLPDVLRMTSASAKSADEARYMHYFENRIEQVGNVNYPQQALTEKIFGRVQLLVVLLADGSIQRIEVLRSSGTRVLDQAAVRSVQLASPFAAFPDELRQHDQIHIIRTWQYQPNNVLITH